MMIDVHSQADLLRIVYKAPVAILAATMCDFNVRLVRGRGEKGYEDGDHTALNRKGTKTGIIPPSIILFSDHVISTRRR